MDRIAVAQALVPMTPMQRALLVGAYAFYLFAVALVALVSGTEGAELVIPALLVLMALRMYPLLRPTDELGWLHPVVFVTAYALIGLARTFGAYAVGLESHTALPGWGPGELSRLVAFELVLAAIGLAAYYLGFFACPAPRAPRIAFQTPRRLPLKVVVSVLLSVVAFGLYMRSQGGLLAHVLSWGMSRHVALEGEAYWSLFSRVGLFGCVVWLASSRAALKHPVFWACSAISLAITFLASGTRAQVVFPIAFGLVVWMLVHGRFSLSRAVILALVGLFLLSVLGEFRAGALKKRVDWGALSASPVEAIQHAVTGELVSRATTGDGVLPILALVPGRVPHLWGSSYVAFAVVPVPRALWPDKPGLIGGQVGKTFFGRQGGVPPGPIGEAYWNFNVPGVVVVFLLFGIFHQWLLRFYLAHRGQAGAAVLYGVTLFIASPATPALVGLLMALVTIAALMLSFGMISFRPGSADRAS